MLESKKIKVYIKTLSKNYYRNFKKTINLKSELKIIMDREEKTSIRLNLNKKFLNEYFRVEYVRMARGWYVNLKSDLNDPCINYSNSLDKVGDMDFTFNPYHCNFKPNFLANMFYETAKKLQPELWDNFREIYLKEN